MDPLLNQRITAAARRLARGVAGDTANTDALVAVADWTDQARLAPVGQIDDNQVAHQLQAALTRHPQLAQREQVDQAFVAQVLQQGRAHGLRVTGDDTAA